MNALHARKEPRIKMRSSAVPYFLLVLYIYTGLKIKKVTPSCHGNFVSCRWDANNAVRARAVGPGRSAGVGEASSRRGRGLEHITENLELLGRILKFQKLKLYCSLGRETGFCTAGAHAERGSVFVPCPQFHGLFSGDSNLYRICFS